jgi:acetyl-CoA synthetase
VATGPATKPGTNSSREFRAAREFLLAHREDYVTASRGFAWPHLDEFNWALDWFDALGTEPGSADQAALWIVEEGGADARFTFAELTERSSRVANWLSGLGVRRGDRLIVMLGNQPELWEMILAAMKLGAVVIPASTLLATADLADRLRRGNARHVVVRDVDAAKFEGVPGTYTRIAVGVPVAGWLAYSDGYSAPAAFRPDGVTHASDPFLLYFTSGTTAQPKLVEHTHASYPAGHLSTMYWIGLEPGDVHLNISSPGWAKHAWSNVFAPWNAGACVFVYNYARFDAEALLAQMQRCGVTSFCAPPTVWRMLIQANLSRLSKPPTKVVGAGEPLNPEIIERVREAWGVTIRDGFGQTETTVQIANTPGQLVKPGSMGRPAPGYRVTLLDPATGEPGDEGEICLDLRERPLGLMTGYRDDETRTAEVMRGGYYHTGDVAAQDADGYITYIGRADDVFKASDYRISPFELESVLLQHEAVAEAAVVPSPDPVRLAVPKAYVTLAAGHRPDRETALSILQFARENLAPYMRIRRLQFAELPKTISGKIRRVELRSRERDLHSGGDAAPPGEYADTDFAELSHPAPGITGPNRTPGH